MTDTKVTLTRTAKDLLRDVRIAKANHADARRNRDGYAMEAAKMREFFAASRLAELLLEQYPANG